MRRACKLEAISYSQFTERSLTIIPSCCDCFHEIRVRACGTCECEESLWDRRDSVA